METKPLRVAIVGEGPTGLLCIAKLLSLLHDKPPKTPLELTWFRYRDAYVRRHVVNISKDFLQEIEHILHACNRCIGADAENGKDELSMSIRTLEYTMNKHIKSTPGFKGVQTKGKFIYSRELDSFDHVHLVRRSQQQK